MSKYFSEIIGRYFTHWIQPKTWHTKHSADMSRFYQFLKAMKRYSRKNSWVDGFYENIVKAAKQYHPEFNESYIQEMASYFTNQAVTIFDYEDVLFPAPSVQRTEPYALWSYLASLEVQDTKGITRKMYSIEQIRDILAKEFGEDWEEKENTQQIIKDYENRHIPQRITHLQEVKELIKVGDAYRILKKADQAKNYYKQALSILEENLSNETQTIEIVKERLARLEVRE